MVGNSDPPMLRNARRVMLFGVGNRRRRSLSLSNHVWLHVSCMSVSPLGKCFSCRPCGLKEKHCTWVSSALHGYVMFLMVGPLATRPRSTTLKIKGNFDIKAKLAFCLLKKKRQRVFGEKKGSKKTAKTNGPSWRPPPKTRRLRRQNAFGEGGGMSRKKMCENTKNVLCIL